MTQSDLDIGTFSLEQCFNLNNDDLKYAYSQVDPSALKPLSGLVFTAQQLRKSVLRTANISDMKAQKELRNLQKRYENEDPDTTEDDLLTMLTDQEELVKRTQEFFEAMRRAPL